MIYFEKNGFQYSTRVFVRKKAFRNKNNGTIGMSRKKSIDIGAWFFFSKTQYTIMSELNRAPFTRKRHRARSVARFCWTLPYLYFYQEARKADRLRHHLDCYSKHVFLFFFFKKTKLQYIWG